MKILIRNFVILLIWLHTISMLGSNVHFLCNKYDVTWTTPSSDFFGSMPLGNGDIGMNVWVEKNGDILFYISKVNAYDSDHTLPKLGKVRIRFSPALNPKRLAQKLQLEDGSIRIKDGDLNIRVIVCANQSIISVDGNSHFPHIMNLSLEPLRPLGNESAVSLFNKGTKGFLLNTTKRQLAWCYKNLSSEWTLHFQSQNTSEMVSKIKDPILNRTSGCLIEGENLWRDGSLTMTTQKPKSKYAFTIKVLSSQPSNFKDWLSEIDKDIKPDYRGHQQYWHEFWNRSFIHVHRCGKDTLMLDQCRYTQIAQGSKAYKGHGKINPDSNALQISQRYALERFCEAIASRGEVPPPYNGSIFTMDMPAGAKKFISVCDTMKSPDRRDWAQLSFMWQNTRHPYMSMFTRGDYDCILPGMKFVRSSLDVMKDHCKKIFGVDGAFIPEASWWYNVGKFNWDHVPRHLRFHQLATIEVPSMMCDYYEHTQDTVFLNHILLPCANEAIKFYANRFTERDKNGKMVMPDVGCVETYQPVTNPCTEIGALKYVLTKLLSSSGGFITKENQLKWEKLLSEMPVVPTRIVKGLPLLAVGDEYKPGRSLCESPELYSVYPFRQAWLGTPNLLSMARLSYHVRNVSLDGTNDTQAVETGGWQSAPVQAAYLGLAREAARMVSINFNDQFIDWHDNIHINTPWPKRPRPRFPVFWECKMDGTPDSDHGANSENALQSMLLQNDGDKIYLLPAWPEDWDVSFKLCANKNTTVDCEYKNGKIEHLTITPSWRKKDIVDMSTPQQRIKTLTEVALSDYDYLYSLPPMLDGMVKSGPVTKAWINNYGYTINDCKAGIWKNALFMGNTVYIHIFDWPVEGLTLSNIDAKLLGYKSVTGNIKITKTTKGWLLSGVPDKEHTIVELKFDRSLLPIALDKPSEKSYCKSEKYAEVRDSAGFLVREVNFGRPVTVGRFEITIDNPAHIRSEGNRYMIQVKANNGTWQTVYQGNVYGLICSKAIQSVQTTGVRVRVIAERLLQFDVFEKE